MKKLIIFLLLPCFCIGQNSTGKNPVSKNKSNANYKSIVHRNSNIAVGGSRITTTGNANVYIGKHEVFMPFASGDIGTFTLIVNDTANSLFIGSFATTYYISPTGNDVTGNGTTTSPWKTLNKAIATVRTFGDVIHVNAGTYVESQSMALAAGVSIEGDNKTTTIIKGNTTGFDVALITLESPDKTNGNQHISNLTFDGQYVSATNHKSGLAIWITGRSNVTIYDCIIKNFWWRGVIFSGTSVDNPGTDIGQNHATGNKFYNNTMTNCADYGLSGGGGSGALNIGFQDGMEIYNNTISQTERPEGKNGWPIKFWNDGWIKGCRIHHNTLIKKPYGGTYPGESGWDFAIEFFNEQGLEIDHNTIQGSLDFNYQKKGVYPYSLWIHDNNITHNPQNSKVEGAIILEYRNEAVIIENNIINNKTYGISFNTRVKTDYGGDNLPVPADLANGGYSYIVDCIIRNNLFNNLYGANGNGVGNRFAIGAISEQDNIGDIMIKNLKITNNTAISKSTDPVGIAVDFTSAKTAGLLDGILVDNNIFQGFSDAYMKNGSTTKAINVQVTNNLLYQNGNNNNPSWTGAYINTANTVGNPNFNANFISPSGKGYLGVSTPPPTPCTSWIFGPWSLCGAQGLQTRQLLSSLPNGCVGTVSGDSLIRSCIIAPPINDTIFCTVILHGNNLTRTAVSYIVKRANGLYYDNKGIERKVKAYKNPSLIWYRFDLLLNKFVLWF